MLDKKVLQLVLDIDIRWSSTDIMIERAIELREVIYILFDPIINILICHQGIELFLDKRDFADLRKHKLSEDEWIGSEEAPPDHAGHLEEGLASRWAITMTIL